MRKTFVLEDLGCANCAAKMEEAIGKLPGVGHVQVNFMRQTMTLETQDDAFDSVVKEAKKIIKRIEPDVTVRA